MPQQSSISMRELSGSSAGKSGFRTLAAISSVLFLSLGCVWMFAPGRSLALWGIQSNDIAELVSRRAAAMYVGLSVMFFMARNAPPSPGRRALVSGLVVACLILAALGLFEIYRGRAQLDILIAVTIEVALPLAFLLVDRRSSDATTGKANQRNGAIQ